MSRFNHRSSDFVPQISFLVRLSCLSVFGVIVVGLVLRVPARGGSDSATIQVSAQVVSSCRVSANSLPTAINSTHLRLNCQNGSQVSALSSSSVRDESANYTLFDVPGTNGAVKLFTVNF